MIINHPDKYLNTTREIFEHYDDKYLKHWFQRDPERKDEELLEFYEKILLEQVICTYMYTKTGNDFYSLTACVMSFIIKLLGMSFFAYSTSPILITSSKKTMYQVTKSLNTIFVFIFYSISCAA